MWTVTGKSNRPWAKVDWKTISNHLLTPKDILNNSDVYVKYCMNFHAIPTCENARWHTLDTPLTVTAWSQVNTPSLPTQAFLTLCPVGDHPWRLPIRAEFKWVARHVPCAHVKPSMVTCCYSWYLSPFVLLQAHLTSATWEESITNSQTVAYT